MTATQAEPRDRRRLALGGLSVVAVGAAAGFLAWHGPYLDGVSCPSRNLTGLDCPGCGSTRCMAALLDGDLGGALDQNVLAVIALPFILWAWGAWMLGTFTGRRYRTPLDRPGAALVTLVLVVGFVVVRNIDAGIGSFLASGTG
jgi:Protein of unknown function (DUF2752)